MINPSGIPFNMNDRILVKMTPHGRAYLAAQHAMFNMKTGRSIPYTPPKEQDGWSTWVVWEFANAFGPELYHGNPNPPVYMQCVLIPSERAKSEPTGA